MRLRLMREHNGVVTMHVVLLPLAFPLDLMETYISQSGFDYAEILGVGE